MSITSKLIHTGMLGLFAASLGVMGCASGDSGSSQADQLTGSPAAAAQPMGGTPKSSSGRAVAVRVNAGKPFGPTSFANLLPAKLSSDTGAAAGDHANTVARINAGNLTRDAAVNASTKGTDSGVTSAASAASGTLFNAAPEGVLKDVLSDGADVGVLDIDLRKLLENLGVKDLLDGLFGDDGAMKLGITYEAANTTATASCDASGNASTTASSKILELKINGKPITVAVGPNAKIDLTNVAGLNVGEVIINFQKSEGGSIDAAALYVELLNTVEVEVSQVHADVSCAHGDH
ncbi:MAG TPA: choice-of-anchor P family protein [Polyangiaceae bacterium]|nr:choice-of-anchor P family protein [Polyangiaceae bacterium]